MATLLPLQTFTGTNGAALPGGAGTGFVNGLIPTGGSALIQNNQAMLTTGSAGGYAGPDRVSQIANLSALADTVYKGTFRWSGDEVYPQLYVRSTNTQVDTAGGYRVALDPVGNTWEVASVAGFTQTPLATATAFSWQTGVDYWVIFGAVGTDLRFVLWQDGQPQPKYASVGTPTATSISLTSSTVTAAGFVGVTVGGGNLGLRTMSFDNVEVFDAFPPVIPPLPHQPRRRQARALPAARRRRYPGPIPVTTVASAALFVPQLRRNRIAKRGVPLRQGSTSLPPAPQPLGPMFDRGSRPPLPATRRLRRYSAPIPPQAAPQFSPIPLVGVTARARALQQRRPRGAGQPLPAQTVLVAPIYPPGAARARARLLLARRPRGVGVPVIAQALPAPPAFPPGAVRARVRALLPRRTRGAGLPVLPQTAPVLVAYAPGLSRAHAKALGRRLSSRVATVVPFAPQPPAVATPRARPVPVRRRPQPAAPVLLQQAAPVPAPVAPGRRRPPARRRTLQRPVTAPALVPFVARSNRSIRPKLAPAPRRRRVAEVPYVGFIPVPGSAPGGVLIGSTGTSAGPVGITSAGATLIGSVGSTYVVGLSGSAT
jgi:hypothetical protein